jgi:peptidylprolyl isomerase
LLEKKAFFCLDLFRIYCKFLRGKQFMREVLMSLSVVIVCIAMLVISAVFNIGGTPTAIADEISTPAAMTQIAVNPTEKTGPELDLANAVETESGLKYIDEVVGEGEFPLKGEMVRVNYVGKLTNGKVFDKSKKPFSFVIGVGQVIKGWDEGVITMQPGGKRTLIIPAELGYGSRGAGGGVIPPNATLIFDVELIGIR